MNRIVPMFAFAGLVCVASSMEACGDSGADDGAVASIDAGPLGSDADALPEHPGDGSSDGSPGGPTQPGLCNHAGFCFEQPLPHGHQLGAVWSAAPNDVWAVAYPDAIL